MIIPIRVDKNSEYDIFCGRPFKYSNPYITGKDGTKVQVIEKYSEYIDKIDNFSEFIRELDGKRLACWCPITKNCHVDVLINKIITYQKYLGISDNFY